MPEAFWWILASGLAMSALALVGAATLALGAETMRRLLPLLVALAAGSLLGGAWFHMIPAAIDELGNRLAVPVWTALGFSLFLVLEQLLHWHHDHYGPLDDSHPERQPLGYLVILADGIHNLLAGLAVAGVFLVDIRLGVITWLAAAAHEVPQELGDFGILVQSGWSRRRALAWNALGGLTFLAGGLIAYGASARYDTAFLIPFAAGNFIYIAAADLVPQIKHHTDRNANVGKLVAFAIGLGVLAVLAAVGHEA